MMGQSTIIIVHRLQVRRHWLQPGRLSTQRSWRVNVKTKTTQAMKLMRGIPRSRVGYLESGAKKTAKKSAMGLSGVVITLKLKEAKEQL